MKQANEEYTKAVNRASEWFQTLHITQLWTKKTNFLCFPGGIVKRGFAFANFAGSEADAIRDGCRFNSLMLPRRWTMCVYSCCCNVCQNIGSMLYHLRRCGSPKIWLLNGRDRKHSVNIFLVQQCNQVGCDHVWEIFGAFLIPISDRW